MGAASSRTSSAKGTLQDESFCFATMLLQLLSNPNLPLSSLRRNALLLSISRNSVLTNPEGRHATLAETVTEAILTSSTLTNAQKDLIVRQGLLQQHWDRVLLRYPPVPGQVCYSYSSSQESRAFFQHRDVFLRLICTSRKVRYRLPQNEFLKAITIIQATNSPPALDATLMRILERTCVSSAELQRIQHDLRMHRYHRLLWSDRLDCLEDTAMDRAFCQLVSQ